MIKLIKTVTFHNFRHFANPDDDCLVLRRVGDENNVAMSFPFHEDTPNFDLTVGEALDLRNALDELVDVKILEAPRHSELFPETFVSNADQRALSGLFDRYPSRSEGDSAARLAIRQAMGVLGLAVGGYVN